MIAEKTEKPVSDIGFLDPGSCEFYLNDNNFLALRANGENYRRVQAARALPLTDPYKCVCVFDMDGNEIGIIEDVDGLTKKMAALVKQNLEGRYFCPELSGISSIRDKMGFFYFDVDINGFKKTFSVKDISKSIRQLENGEIILTDVDGNRFKIPDIYKIKPKSRRLLEPYLY
ncbi:MAG: DUF1854 domain-containing protein [Oscillospiraceae bacterium]|nr:DUF1854 domain-containing protein [Oscillospiraceae bacterium]